MEIVTRVFTKIIYWQNHPSIHQSAFVRALAERDNTEVWFAYEEDIPASRQAMGWTCPNHGTAQLVDVREVSHFESLVSMDDAETLHLFGAFFNLPIAKRALQRLKKRPCTRVWTTEAFNYTGWRGWIRLWRSRWLAISVVNHVFHDVFAMGKLGAEFFEKSWVDSERIHEFGYLVEPPQGANLEINSRNEQQTTKIAYVGQLIDRKGVDILLEALESIRDLNWTLNVIGDGDRRLDLIKQTGELDLEERVVFHGNKTNDDALEAIAKTDIFVLPSRWDGWGAVVNEALMLGTQVIASDLCGASALLRNSVNGHVFQSGNSKDLSEKLKQSMSEGRFDARNRQERREWAEAALGGHGLAEYFVNSIMASRSDKKQMPPWVM